MFSFSPFYCPYLVQVPTTFFHVSTRSRFSRKSSLSVYSSYSYLQLPVVFSHHFPPFYKKKNPLPSWPLLCFKTVASFFLRSSSPLSGTITCMFVVSAAIGEMIIPLIVGKVFDYIGPISFLAEGCILCFVAIGTYLAVMIMGKSLSLQRGKCCNPPT